MNTMKKKLYVTPVVAQTMIHFSSHLMTNGSLWVNEKTTKQQFSRQYNDFDTDEE